MNHEQLRETLTSTLWGKNYDETLEEERPVIDKAVDAIMALFDTYSTQERIDELNLINHALQYKLEKGDWETLCEYGNARLTDLYSMQGPTKEGEDTKTILHAEGYSHTRLVYFVSEHDGSYCYSELGDGYDNLHYLHVANPWDDDFAEWVPVSTNDFDLGLCNTCNQMTNHLHGICQKHEPTNGDLNT